MPPLVSILTPLYNRERHIADCVKSVLAQTHRDIEYIIIDDGSTDGSVLAAESAANGDPRVRIIRVEHAGVTRTVYRAFAEARCAFVGTVDSDDVLGPRAVERTLEVLLAKPEVGVVYTDHAIADASGKVLGMGARCTIPYSKDRLLIDFMTFAFRLLRREVFDKAGGINTNYAIAHDYDLCLRLSEVTTFEHLREVHYTYRQSTDTISHTRRLEQIESSARAVREALARRGMEGRFRLEVEIMSKFKLVPIAAGGPG